MCLGIPGQVLEIYEAKGGLKMGKMKFGGITREACLEYLPEAKIGDYALIHVGFALCKVDEEEAAKMYQLLAEMGEVQRELEGRA